MLIRLSGGAGGIAEYLENGRKRGREFERDTIDQRVPLSGNLEQVRIAIDSMRTRTKSANRYLHITLGFAERFQDSGALRDGAVTLDTLRAVDDDFKRYFMAAYSVEEYQYYSEAHLPKLSHEIGTDGVTRARLPHIHVVIPMRNLVDGKFLNPRGHGVANLHYIDAIQETINSRHRLKSPKSARRQLVPDALARHAGSRFNLHTELQQELSKGEIGDLDALAKWATAIGEVRIRQGREGRYLNVKIEGAERGINLKAYSDAYFAILQRGPEVETAFKLAEHWVQQGSFEARYITSQRLNRYRALSDADKQVMLEAFKLKTALAISLLDKSFARPVDLAQPLENAEFEQEHIDGPARSQSQPRRSADATAVVDDRRRQPLVSALALNRAFAPGEENNGSDPTPDQLKRETRAQLVIAFAATTYGIDPAQYAAGWATDGSPRILHQDRQYNLGDFFTKHLKKDWTTARAALLVCWNHTKRDGLIGVERSLWSEFDTERLRDATALRQRRSEILLRWKQEREQIRADWRTDVAALEKRSRQRPVVRAIRVTRDLQARDKALRELETLKHVPRADAYRDFLGRRAEQGDVGALEELRCMAVTPSRDTTPRISGDPRRRSALIVPGFEVDRGGSVRYQHAGSTLVVDAPWAVRVLQTTAQSYELALRVAVARYGNRLVLAGDDHFKRQMIAAAEHARLSLTLCDERGLELPIIRMKSMRRS